MLSLDNINKKLKINILTIRNKISFTFVINIANFYDSVANKMLPM